MKICIDSRSINLHGGTGIGTYTKNLISEMINLDKDSLFTLIWTGQVDSSFINNNTELVHCSGRHSNFFDKYYIPNLILEKNLELYHIPQNGIGSPLTENINTVVTIHDLIPYIMPETVGQSYLKRFLKTMPDIIENSKGIITVSEYSKRDILKFFKGYPEDKIFVTHLSTNSEFYPRDKEISRKIVNNNYNFDTPYLLYIGGFSARKNVKGILDAFKRIKGDLTKKYKLLLVGSLKDEGLNLKKYAEDLNIIDDIVFTGFVEDSFLPTLYSGADLFVYPSYYEGFGLPPLEAMSCKTAVITSNTTSIPEVTNDCAILINPANNDSLSQNIFKLLENTEERVKLEEKAYKRSLQFSWRQTAFNTLNAYEEVLKSLIQ
ncbi:glycosyltransferase family 1 protein [Clostridium sp. Ade.TY]|uniref:glycosyltransferase family 4 protein n=1 Tax=Clostridium sp. Ade.TY TaxID=1391647 RepID=UPI0004158ED7|nr:glycosyltransferase family 1 protein [Clostridium sp. Ade.TY]